MAFTLVVIIGITWSFWQAIKNVDKYFEPVFFVWFGVTLLLTVLPVNIFFPIITLIVSSIFGGGLIFTSE